MIGMILNITIMTLEQVNIMIGMQTLMTLEVYITTLNAITVTLSSTMAMINVTVITFNTKIISN